MAEYVHVNAPTGAFGRPVHKHTRGSPTQGCRQDLSGSAPGDRRAWIILEYYMKTARRRARVRRTRRTRCSRRGRGRRIRRGGQGRNVYEDTIPTPSRREALRIAWHESDMGRRTRALRRRAAQSRVLGPYRRVNCEGLVPVTDCRDDAQIQGEYSLARPLCRAFKQTVTDPRTGRSRQFRCRRNRRSGSPSGCDIVGEMGFRKPCR